MYQNNFGQQQQFGQQMNKYQPVGFVQSQYQGNIPKAQSQSFSSNYASSSQPVISHVGYTNASPSQSFGMSNQMGSGISHTSYQPVISHVGTTANQSFNYQSHAPVQAHTSSYQPVISHLGTTAGQQGVSSFQSMAPSHTQSSYQPVISHVGYTAGQDFSRSQFGAPQQQSFNSSFAQSAHAQTPFNPVYQATNQAQSAGPVLSHVGYSSPSNMGTGFNSAGRF